MTIVETNLIESDGQITLEGPRYRRKWQVFFTGGYDPAYLNSNTEPDLQLPGAEYPLDSRAYATSAAPSLDNDSPAVGTTEKKGVAYWEIQYDPKPLNSWFENPLLRDPTIEGAGSDLTEVARVDQDNNPVANSAGDFYDPLPERPVQAGQYTITRNEADNPVQMAATYSNTINDGTWHGRDAGTVQFGLIAYRKVVEQVGPTTYTYFQVSYPIKENPNGWKFKPIDNGWRKKDEDGDLHNISDPVGNTTMIPVLLDGEGGVLPEGGTPVVYPTDGYAILYETNWGGLSLPDPDSL